MAIDDFIKVLGLGKIGMPAADFAEEELPKVPGQFQLPGEEFEGPAPAFANSLVQGEQAGIPNSSIKSSKRSLALEGLNSIINPKPEMEQGPFSEPTDVLSPYQKDLDEALVDRERRMNETVRNAGVTDFIAAGNRALGLKDDRRGTGDAEKKRLEDIKLKDFNERLGLSSKVLGAEKSKSDLQMQGSLNDPNSAVSASYRMGAKQLLGNSISDEALSKLSAAQIQTVLGDDLAGVLNNVENRKARDQQFRLQMEDRALAREDRELLRKDKQDTKFKTDLLKSMDSLPKISAAYKRYQEIQPTYEYALGLSNGEIVPDGATDAALALQAIKIAQGDTSVVRESDLEQFKRIGGLEQVLRDAKQKVMGGQKLSPEVQRAFINIILDSEKKIRKSAKEQTQGKYNEFKKSDLDVDFMPGTLKQIHEKVDAESSTIKDPKVEEYATQHFNGDYQKAKAFLVKRGYKAK